jgi:hypothetical protein
MKITKQESTNPEWEVNGYRSGNSQLIMDYRELIWKAYELGKDIKKLYGIIPPKVHYTGDSPAVVLGLTIN